MHIIRDLLIAGIKNKEFMLIDWEINIEKIILDESFKIVRETKMILENEYMEDYIQLAKIRYLYSDYEILKSEKDSSLKQKKICD